MSESITAGAAQPAKAFNPAVVVAVCFGIAALEGYDIQAVGVAAPSMAPALHMAEAYIGYASSWSMVGLVLGAIAGGWIADRIGRKSVLVASVAWFGVFSLLTAMVQDAHMLLVLRFLTGLGFGGAMPNMIAVASEISSPERKTATVTTMFVGMPSGGGVASLITLGVLMGYLPHNIDWRLIYAVGGIVPILLAPLAWLLLPETRPSHEGKQGNPVQVLLGEGRALTSLTMWIAFGFTLVVLYLMLGWLPMLVVSEGLSKIDGAWAAFWFNLAGIVGGLALGRLIDAYDFRWPLAVTYIGLIASMAALSKATGIEMILVFAGLAGCFVVGAQYALYGIAPVYYPANSRALGAGAAVGAGRLGAIVGPTLAASLREHHASSAKVIGVTLPVILVAGVAAVALTYVGKRLIRPPPAETVAP